MIAGIALRFVPQLVTEMHDIRLAQQSRGARLAGSPVRGIRQVSSVAIPLMAGVFRHAETAERGQWTRAATTADRGARPCARSGSDTRDAVAVLAYVVLLAMTLAINALG